MHYYKFNIGDYARRTKHLTPTEDIIYRRLLDLYYLNEIPFTDDTQDIAKDIGMREYCDDIEYILSKFFPYGKNKHADSEILKYQSKSIKAKASADARWNNKDKDGAKAMRTHSEGNANHKPLTNNHKPITNIKDKTCATSVTPKQVVDLWNTSMIDTYARQKKVVTANLESVIRSRSKTEFTSTDDWSSYFDAIKTSDFLMGKIHGNNRKPFQVSLEWVVKPDNVAKIIEGAYHHG